ncbi:MAG: hypothetical protein HYV40_00540 [Candidatus Levybacteria bacterium]|nr:hypothetical protein [Candidatus Levybacteria bacterium]
MSFEFWEALRKFDPQRYAAARAISEDALAIWGMVTLPDEEKKIQKRISCGK